MDIAVDADTGDTKLPIFVISLKLKQIKTLHNTHKTHYSILLITLTALRILNIKSQVSKKQVMCRQSFSLPLLPFTDLY